MSIPKISPQPIRPIIPCPRQLDELNHHFAKKDAGAVLSCAVNDLTDPNLAVLSSFGADSAVLLHILSSVAPDLPVLFLETGQHFAQTLEYVGTLTNHLKLRNVQLVKPSSTELKKQDPSADLWKIDTNACCDLRKTMPMQAMLEQFDGWVTGRKRYQTHHREALMHFEVIPDGRIKINPLAFWSVSDLTNYANLHHLPRHPLEKLGYRSIGCAPCTIKTCSKQRPRAGRWPGSEKTECGIHFDD